VDDYGYERKTDHDRVITSGAWLGFGLGVALLGWLDGHIPHLLGFLLNWTAVLAVCYAMAVWKRAWYAWAAFWGMAVLCVTGGIMQLLGLLTSQWSTGSWVIGCTMVFVWYWLVRIPRLHPPAPLQVSHVIHHHVFHAPGAALPAPGDAVTQLPASQQAAVPGRVLRAINPPKTRARQIGESIRQAIRRR
jgi:hypothetical protein